MLHCKDAIGGRVAAVTMALSEHQHYAISRCWLVVTSTVSVKCSVGLGRPASQLQGLTAPSSGRPNEQSIRKRAFDQQAAHLEASDQLVLGLGQLSLGGRPQQGETHDVVRVHVHEQLGLRDGIREASSRG